MTWALCGLGNVLLGQGRAHEALEPFERIVSICAQSACAPDAHGCGLLGLAQALVATAGNTSRAVNLAKQAREVIGQDRRAFLTELEEVNNWLRRWDKTD